MYKITIVLITFLLASCSVIKVTTNDEVKTYRKLGFVNVVTPPNSGTYVEFSFLGFGFSDHDLILGYKRSNQLSMTGDSCTVFIDNESKIDNKVLDYLESINCNFIYLHGEKNAK